MTLVKTKTRTSPHQRKISGDHHKKSQKYLKAYWPYIPIVLILGGALVANVYLPTSLGNKFGSSTYNARIESVIGVNTTLVNLMYLALAVLAVWYIIRHFKRFKQLVLEGEHYLARHYMLDISLALIIGALYILVR